MENFIKVCFWKNPNGSLHYYHGKLEGEKDPEALFCITEGFFETNEGKAVVFYMKNGEIPSRNFMYRGLANCRICGIVLGDSDVASPDGKYLYPEFFWHYIEKHDIKPKNENFIQDSVEYYENHKNDSPRTKNCKICKIDFLADHRGRNFCGPHCSEVNREIEKFYSLNDVKGKSETSKWLLHHLTNLGCHRELKQNIEDFLFSVKNCVKCGKEVADSEICDSHFCQGLYKYDSLPDVKLLAIMEDASISEKTRRELLKVRFATDLDKVQRVVNGKTGTFNYRICD